MKKIMFMLAAVVCAAGVQAASYQWRVGSTAVYDGTGGTTATTMTQVFLFNTTDYSQQTLLDALNGGTALSTIQGNAVGVGSLASGKMTGYVATTDSADAGSVVDGTVNNYFAIFNEAANKVFLMTSKGTAVMTGDGDVTQVTFSSYGTPSKSTSDSATFSSAGWYSYSSSSGDDPAIPEPTSGLLMLVGLGALALRRRR